MATIKSNIATSSNSAIGINNNAWSSTSTSSIVNTSSNPFVVTSGSSNAITVDSTGNTVIEKLILKDEMTGRKWQLKVSDGELIVEPLELEDKRDWKIKKILNEKTSEV